MRTAAVSGDSAVPAEPTNTAPAAGQDAGLPSSSQRDSGVAKSAVQMQAGAAAGAGSVAAGQAGTAAQAAPDHFSFFVASYAALQRLSGSSDGFGGDLRYGEADGLAGADKICREIAESSLPGAGSKVWRAFLSVTRGADGQPVNAIDRVGNGPWYDRLQRVVAMTLTDLAMTRPQGADPNIIDDLPNEDGVPNHEPDGTEVDNHDVLTGSDQHGKLYSTDWKYTCHDWTSIVPSDGTPRVGHSWPRMGAGLSGIPPRSGNAAGSFGAAGTENWMSALTEAGCAAGVNLEHTGGPNPSNPTVGSGGGYGAFYCFALTP